MWHSNHLMLIFSATFHNAKVVINHLQELAARMFNLKLARSRKPSALTQRGGLVFEKIMPSCRTAMLLEKTKSIERHARGREFVRKGCKYRTIQMVDEEF